MGWATRNTHSIPKSGSPTNIYEINDYSLGFNTFLSNDKFPFASGKSNLWRLAKNARINTLGEYTTRKGWDFFSNAAGEAKDQEQTSTTGASDQPFDTINRLAQSFTAAQSGVLSKIEINIKNANGASGVPIVELWSDDSGPAQMIARSSVDPADITSSYQYLVARFASAPAITATETYWIVVYTQANSGGQYEWSSTTSASTAVSSSDGGTTWDSESFALNFKQYYATAGAIKGIFRSIKSDGTRVTLFAHGTSVYSVNEVTGALTAIKTGLNAASTDYQFVQVNDIIYYINGHDGLRKWDFSTESQVNSTDYLTIVEHKGMLFLARKDDPTRIDFSNFADYETFTSTDFVYAPSPKTGDPVVATVSLNGYLLVFTLNNKYILSGDDRATFAIDEAPDQKGTYSYKTVTADKNFVYYLSNDGVYRSNGNESQLISQDVYTDILNLPNKETSVIHINGGELYLWYTPLGASENNECFVFSINFGDEGGTTESLDTSAYVAGAVNGYDVNDVLIVGSSRLGQLYYQELDSNDYSILGGDIDFELRTHYIIGGSPAVLKEYRKYQPRFQTTTGSYGITIQYAYDLRDNWTTIVSPDLQGAGATYGDGSKYGDGTKYGVESENQQYLNVPGQYRRTAIRYVHTGARQGHTFLGHTFVTQTRRFR